MIKGEMKELTLKYYKIFLNEGNNKENYISTYLLNYNFYKNRMDYNIRKGNLEVPIVVLSRQINKRTGYHFRYFVLYTTELLKFIKRKKLRMSDVFSNDNGINILIEDVGGDMGLLGKMLLMTKNNPKNSDILLNMLEIDLLDNILFTETSFYKKYNKNKEIDKLYEQVII